MTSTRTTIKTLDERESDHDILISLVTKFDFMAQDIKDLKDKIEAMTVKHVASSEL